MRFDIVQRDIRERLTTLAGLLAYLLLGNLPTLFMRAVAYLPKSFPSSFYVEAESQRRDRV